jgi:integrase
VIRKIERADGVIKWQVYGRVKGKQTYAGTYATRKEALAADEDHRVTQRKIASGELPPAHDTKKTLGDALDEWLTALEKARSRSHRPYSEFVKYQIKPTLAGVPIAKFTKERVESWRDASCRQYAPSTVNSALGCLSSAFAWFVGERKWIPANPCIGVEQAEVQKRKDNWIRTRGELERLLLACSDELRDMVAFSVGTALRIDEMLHLQWDDIDFDNRLICVQRGRQGPPKGGRIRYVPILDSVLGMLKARALRRGGSTLVFPGRDGTVRTRTPVTCAYKSALRRAQMDTSLRWHDLRHTAASWWVMSGGDIFRLSKMMGHRSVKVTEERYAHLAPEAWTQDYARISFHVPSEPGKVYEIRRDERGKLAGRTAVMIDARAVAR